LIVVSATKTHQTEKCKTEKWQILFFCLTFFCLVAETMITARPDILGLSSSFDAVTFLRGANLFLEIYSSCGITQYAA